MVKKVKHLEVEEEIHRKLKVRATKKGKTLKEEVKEILIKELEVENTNE